MKKKEKNNYFVGLELPTFWLIVRPAIDCTAWLYDSKDSQKIYSNRQE